MIFQEMYGVGRLLVNINTKIAFNLPYVKLGHRAQRLLICPDSCIYRLSRP